MRVLVTVRFALAAAFTAVMAVQEGCAPADVASGCTQDSECGPGLACFARSCMSRVPSSYAASFRLVPRDSQTSGATELPAQPIAGPSTVLPLERRVNLVGRARSPQTAPFAQVAQGQLSLSFRLPPGLSGAPDRQATAIADLEAAGGVVPFALAIPETWAGQTARVFVTPRAPVDLVLPPVEQDIVLVPDMQVTLPGAMELRAVEGVVRDEFDQAVVGYVVRVFRGNALVSSRAVLAQDGRFRVNFTRQPPPDLVNEPPTLVLAATGAGARPQVRLVLGDNTTDVGTLRLPPHPLPQPFRVPVTSTDAEGRVVPVLGAVVRMETQVNAPGTGATAVYTQEAQAGLDGIVQLPLIPGALEQPQVYKLHVRSPATAEAASACFGGFAVGATTGGDGTTPTTATIELRRRPALVGIVKGPDMTPLPGAVATAVRTGPLPDAPDCEALAHLGPAAAVSDELGQFRLRLEPGVYKVDLRPPTGAPVALLSFAGVAVGNDGVLRDFVLPRGQLLEAQVLEADGRPCATCEVSVYDPAGGDLAFRAEAVTDDAGRFRTVVPAP